MKIGDVVRITKGEVLQRVGYPETLGSSRHKLEDEFSKTNGKSPLTILKGLFPFGSFNTHMEIVNLLSKDYNKNVLKFGGNKRRVYVEYRPELDGVVMQINNRIVRQTGDYSSLSYGDDDNQAFLANRQTHVFFSVIPIYNGVPIYMTKYEKGSFDYKSDVYINKKNLEFLYTP